MKLHWTLLFLLGSILIQAQSIKDLEAQLQNAETSRERMNLNYELGKAWLVKDARKAVEYGKAAHNRAQVINHNGMLAQAAFLVGQAYNRIRKEDRNEETWLKSALKYAQAANDADLIIKSVEALSRLAIKGGRGDYRKAYGYTEEAFQFFSQGGKSISELERFYEQQEDQLEKERKALVREMETLEAEINRLSLERDVLRKDKTALTQRQQVLEEEKATLEEKKEIVEQEVAAKEEEIEQISRKEINARYKSEMRKRRIDSLEHQQQIDSLALEQTNLAVQNLELENERSRYIFMLLGAISLFVIFMALVFYLRFRAKKRLSNQLEMKNQLLDDERQRSDDLLLNILPATIAQELKEKGTATAQKFNEASILFSDFKNFTRISEQLSPEELVKLIDTTFKAFDNIISHYEDIEKIKTIGDAYMCASGLVNRKTIPANLIKAALEMQEYLHDTKQERMRKGEPYFEARIGIHTGPVVAGVVGLKKFGYDIWGDTVNIAARMEANCEVGQINISETTHGLVKYNFDCQYRGKVHAKNKGMIDMYYVKRAM